eukprot:4201365-Pleurochrysis_carterae.AAC.1
MNHVLIYDEQIDDGSQRRSEAKAQEPLFRRQLAANARLGGHSKRQFGGLNARPVTLRSNKHITSTRAAQATSKLVGWWS